MSLDVAVSREFSLVFPTPILTRTLFTDSFNERLARVLLARRRRGEGSRSKGGGWQSAPDLLNWPELEVKFLATEIFNAMKRINAESSDATVQSTDAVSAEAGSWNPNGWNSLKRNHEHYRGRAWANVNGDGHYDSPRVQPGYQWCAIYHVATGRLAPDRVRNGTLEIMDPRPAASFGQLEKFAFGHPLEIEPKAGLVVIFPAWLQYCVHPFFGMGHRISITMNISVEEE
jgi:hypothetical protein